MECRESFMTALDGSRLFVRHWHDPIPAGRTLVIVHGAGEHGGRYEHFAAKFVSRGWNVIAADARGHGRSEGVPTHINSFNQYLDDLIEVLRATSPIASRTAIFAHSLGGLIVARALQTAARPPVGAAVLSSPLLALHVRVPAVKRAIGRICSWFSPETRFRSNIRGDQLTRSEWAQRRREEDPHGQRSVTAGWYFQVLDAAFEAWADAARLTVPILLQQGDADEVVDPDAPLPFWERLGSRDRMLRILPDHLHELAAEPTWELTADFILGWLESRVPRPSGDESTGCSLEVTSPAH
jgi:lysophospholipase